MFVFFFKQKTAYEMRISDWSSDVCSSDLGERRIGDQADAFLPAHLRQLVFETAVVEAEIILDRMIARNAQLLRRRERLHQPPARLVRAAEDAHLSFAHQLVERVPHLVIWRVMVGPVRLVEIEDRKSTRLNSSH